MQSALIDQIHLLANCSNELRATIDINRNSVEMLICTIDISKEELQTATQLVNEATDALASHTSNQTLTQPPTSTPLQANSYTEIVRQTSHATAVAHCNSQARTIHLTHPHIDSDSNASLNNLSKDVLVKKANIALELAQKEDDAAPPPGAKFLLVRKTTHGSLLYEVDSEETTAWLRSTRGQQIFAAKFGTEVSLASKPFSVISNMSPYEYRLTTPTP